MSCGRPEFDVILPIISIEYLNIDQSKPISGKQVLVATCEKDCIWSSEADLD